MKSPHLMIQLGLSLSAFCLSITANSGSPLLTFAPHKNYPPTVSVSTADTAIVKYNLKNKSKKNNFTLIMKHITGIRQVTSGDDNCEKHFTLGPKMSCTLTLQVIGRQLTKDILGGPKICNNDNPSQCYQPAIEDILKITKENVTTLYVNGSSAKNGDGSSWANAFNNLESALKASGAKRDFNQIWVAKGVYKPSKIYAPQGIIGGAYHVKTPKLKTFNLPKNTAIYGGFSGSETKLAQRNGKLNPTILCGDMTSTCLTPFVPGIGDDRVWHVLMAGSDIPPGTGVANVKLDSLIIRGGYAAGPDKGTLGVNSVLRSLDYEHAAGGGLLARYGSTIEISNVIFEHNTSDSSQATVKSITTDVPIASGGGAVAAIDTDTSISVIKSRFMNNTAISAGGSGGALENLIDASYTITSSKFEQNTADRNGGAIRAKDAGDVNISSSHFRNNSISGPAADASGGALGIINANLSVLNSTFDKNSIEFPAGLGGGAIFFHIAFDDGTPYFLTVDNSSFKMNIGGAFGGGGINVLAITPNPDSRVNITNSKFIENNGGVGGGLYLDGVSSIITKSTFLNNTAQLEGGAIFASNFSNTAVGSTLQTKARISNDFFANNSITGVPGGSISPLFFFNFIAGLFGSSVTTMAPGGGAIAVEFAGDVEILNNTFSNNLALKNPLEEDNRGGAILVGGTAGTPSGMSLAHACVSSNLYVNNKADIGNNIAKYNPANIPGGVTVDACSPPIR